MAFLDITFPPHPFKPGTTAAPGYSIAVQRVSGGQEFKLDKWTYPLQSYRCVINTHVASEFYDFLSFFHAVRGRANSFRFIDPAEVSSNGFAGAPTFLDQTIGTGDGATTVFQLSKTYTYQSAGAKRKITRPVTGTVLIGVNGVAQPSGWSVNVNTGQVTFTVAPPSGHSVTAGFNFHVPARLDVDAFEMVLGTRGPSAETLITTELPIVEVRE